jgi:high affinity Mn2+ porin
MVLAGAAVRRFAAGVLLGCAFASRAWAQPPAPSTTAQPTPAKEAPASDAPGAEQPPPPPPERFAFHAQSTFTYQGQDGFHAPYSGPNSLSPKANARETWDLTLFAGVRLWRGAELWIDPEVDQGFGLRNTLGVAGFTSGEAYKVGNVDPYFRLQRVVFRQTLDLPGETEAVDPDQNQLGGGRSSNRLVFTGGKFSVADIFDTNTYAHDPRSDFLNWSIIDAGSFDYAADSWGYTAGAALEWYQAWWTLRSGMFLLSNVPNSPNIDTRFEQFQLIEEAEERHSLWGRPGKLKLTGFLSRGRMAKLNDATTLGLATGTTPDVAAVRRYASRPGVSLNAEQQIVADLGAFARAGWADGGYETYEFSDIDRSLSGGLSLAGTRWGRKDDTVALAGVINQASADRLRYLAAGGLGILIGDGQLPHPGTERIVETYYKASLAGGIAASLDYQWVTNPGYNRDRGPVSVLALRLHGQF